MSSRKHQPFAKELAKKLKLKYQPVAAINEVLALSSRPRLPVAPERAVDLAALANVSPDAAFAVLDWYRRHPNKQGRIRKCWQHYVQYDLVVALRDILRRSPLSLPDLSVYPKFDSTYVSWSGGGSFRDVCCYLADSFVKLTGVHDVLSDVYGDIGRFVAVNGDEVTLRRTLSPEQFLSQANHGGCAPSQIWDASSSPFGDGYLISPVS